MAHRNTILSQMLKYISRHRFQTCVEAHHGDHRVRTLDCWTQLVAMLVGHVTQRKSLRDIESCLESAQVFRYHSGIGEVRRSTLADANESRSHDIFSEFFGHFYSQTASLISKRAFKLKAPVKIFDATWIDLCLGLFPWAKSQKGKAGVRMHTVYDLNSQMPSCVTITDTMTYETTIARQTALPPGSIFIFDRGIIDFEWFFKLDQDQSFFVTRLKSNADFKIIASRKIPNNGPVIADETIALVGVVGARKYPKPIRKILVKDPQTGRECSFFTNAFHLSATTIAQLYKARWQVELFFKWIKQNLRIKRFLGTSQNAVKIQIWVALIAYILCAYLKHLSRSPSSMLEITRLLQMNIFRKFDLANLLRKEFQRFKPPTSQNQLCFQTLLTGQ